LKAAQYLTHIGVTDLHWCKSILVNLFEHGFTEVSPMVRCEITMYRRVFWSTLLLERGFNFCREASKQSKKGAFGAEALWHTFVYGCDVLADHDRPAPRPSEKARQSTASVDERTFKPVEEDTLFPKDKLLPMTTPSQGGCRKTSTQSLKHSPMALLAMVQENGNWQTLQNAYLSLLVYPGDILIARDHRKPMLVLTSTSKGCWLYRVDLIKINGELSLDFNGSPKAALEFHAVVDHSRYKASSAKVCLPRASKLLTPGLAIERYTLVAAVATELLVHASDTGFRGMPKEFLKRLFKLEKVLLDHMPESEAGLVDALVRHAQPGISDEDVLKKIEARNATIHSWDDHSSSQIFEKGALDWVSEIVEEEDLRGELEDVESQIVVARRLAKERAEVASAVIAIGAASSSACGGVPIDGPTRITHTTGVISIVWARSLMPPEHSLTWEPESNSWRVRSRHMMAGRSRAVGKGTGETQWDALKFMLTIAWSSWRTISDVPCPFLFD
jgi:hypothetical protein